MKIRLLPSIALAAVAALLAACSSIKTYPNDLPKNARIETTASPGVVLEKLNIALNLYDVDEKCLPSYRGTVALDRPLIELGLPEQKQLYLEVQSGKSDLLDSARSSSGYGTLLRPYSGHQYLIEVDVVRDRYNVSVRDKSDQSIAVVTRAPLDSCGRP